MKLRIRYDKKTKVLSLADEPAPTVAGLKTAVKDNIFEEWGFSQDCDFGVSLDGKTSIGEDAAKLRDAGIVSGDLIKLILGAGLTQMADAGPSISKVDTTSTESASAMSLAQTDLDEPGTSIQSNFEEIPCFSPGPIFFRECDGVSEVPHLVQQIYENDAIKNEFQALCIVLHFMMCESGFYIEGITEHADVLPLLQPFIFAAAYSHAACPGLNLNFSCNQLGSFVLVNAVVQPCRVTTEQVITLQVVTKDYIETFNSENKNSNAAAVYKSLSKLNRQVKETIAHPSLNSMREELELPPVHGLLSLFPEILQLIFTHLDFKGLAALSQVNRALSEITADDNLWRNLYIKDFKSHPVTVEATWKATYARKHIRQKEHRREMERRIREYDDFTRPRFGTPDPMFPMPQPQQPFGMIGGEHDLRPSFPYGPFASPPHRLPPTRPVHPLNPDNPLPGSRFDPIYPGGGFRPGRGGGMMDPDLEGLGGPMMPFSNRQGRARHNQRFGFL